MLVICHLQSLLTDRIPSLFWFFLFLVTRNPTQIWKRGKYIFSLSALYTYFSFCSPDKPLSQWLLTWSGARSPAAVSCHYLIFASPHSSRWKISAWVLLSLTSFPSHTYPTFADNGHSSTYSSKTRSKCASFLLLWITLWIKQKSQRCTIIRFNRAGCHVKQTDVLKRWACQSGTFLTPLH